MIERRFLNMFSSRTDIPIWSLLPFDTPKSFIINCAWSTFWDCKEPMLQVIDYAVTFRNFPDSHKGSFISPILEGPKLYLRRGKRAYPRTRRGARDER